MRCELSDLAKVLEECGEQTHAASVRAAATGSEDELTTFLISNDLWGGAGSVADQASVGQKRTDECRAIEAALIRLGYLQIQSGKVNVRTAGWVAAFKEWAKCGI